MVIGILLHLDKLGNIMVSMGVELFQIFKAEKDASLTLKDMAGNWNMNLVSKKR
jgi:hypothetical protein